MKVETLLNTFGYAKSRMCIPEQPESIQNNQHTTIQVSCFTLNWRHIRILVRLCVGMMWLKLFGMIELCRRVDVDIMCGLVIYASGGGWELLHYCSDI